MLKFKKNQFVGVGMLLVVASSMVIYEKYTEKHKEQKFIVQFERGLNLKKDQSQTLTKVATKMFENNDYVAFVIGHTETQGNHNSNITLSEKRANIIKKLIVDKNIKPKRIKTNGSGGSKPLEKKTNESYRAYQSRLSRATIILRSE